MSAGRSSTVWVCVLSAIAMALPAASLADTCGVISGNLVLNCGFEYGNSNNWTATPTSLGSAFYVVPTSAHSGNYSMTFGAAGPGEDMLSQIISNIVPGVTYDLSFWVTNAGNNNNQFQAAWDGHNLLNLVNSPAFGYTHYSFNVEAAGGDTISFSSYNSPSWFYLDDVSVAPGNNLIFNGDFETGNRNGWSFTPAASDSDLLILSNNNLPAQSLNYSAAFGAYNSQDDALSQSFATVYGRQYNISFWVANNDTAAANHFEAEWDGHPLLNLSNASAFGYTEYSYSMQGTGNDTLSFLGYNNARFFSLDNVTVASANNLVLNGSFETATDDFWTLTRAGVGSDFGIVSGSDAKSGNDAAGFGATASQDDSLSQILATENGATYDFTFWLLNTDTRAQNQFEAEWDGHPLLNLINASAFGYTEYSFSVTGTGNDTINFLSYNTASFYYLDFVSVVETAPPPIPEPGSVWSLGSGLLVLAAAAKRKMWRKRQGEIGVATRT